MTVTFAAVLALIVCLTLPVALPVDAATIIAQLSYTSSPTSQCSPSNYISTYNQTAGVCTAATGKDTSSAVYCNAEGSYVYYATWTGSTCSGSTASLTRYATGCGVLSYQAQFQCLDNTGPYLPDAFGTSWPPGDDWAISTSYRNLTNGGKRLSTCPSDTTGLVQLQSATRYGYCQRASSTGTNTFDQSMFYTCSGSTQTVQQFVGTTTCESSGLAIIEQKSGCSDGYLITCGSASGGSTGTIQVGIKALEYSDSQCMVSLDQGIIKPDTCVNSIIASCVEQNGATIVTQKRYSDTKCQNLTETNTYQQNLCTIDPDSKSSWSKVSCVTDGGGIGGVGSASTIGISIVSVIATVAMAVFGTARSF